MSSSDYVIPWQEIAEMELVIRNTLSEERKLLKAAMGWTWLESFWLSPTGSIGTGLRLYLLATISEPVREHACCYSG